MTDAVETRLAATVLLARDSADGIELFMVERHHEIDFAGGALVFPGGSVDPTDHQPELRALADGADTLDNNEFAVRVAAAREAFEECGVLYARESLREATVSGERARTLGSKYRRDLEQGNVTLGDMLRAENLRLALDELHHFAHWVTPENMPKRFDTHFFIARAPGDHWLKHDGSESTDSVWITPRTACSEADAGRRMVIFPTRLNIEKVGRSATVGEALERASSAPVVSVRPQVEEADGGRLLRIPAAAGYGGSAYFVAGKPGQLAIIERRE